LSDLLAIIDARAAARDEIGGVERWTREMADRLPRLRPGAYLVARPPKALAHRAGHLWEQLALPARARRRGAALTYCPANLAPLAGRGNVLLLHDLAGIQHPEWYSRAYVTWQRSIVPRIVRGARRVVSVSEYSRGEIARALHLDPAEIAVIPGGVDERFTPQADADGARRELRLEGPYVLTVGTRHPRKNLGVLETAARRLRDRGVELVSAGGDRAYMRPGAAAPGVRPLGYVPERLLPGLYAGAEAFVLPAREEGFGLPCLEAMAAGTPVVAARSGALPETCADAALLVDPADAQAVADAIDRALGSDRDRLRAAGRERASQFSWDRAARRTDELLFALASEGDGSRFTP
jgi:glycosyltransferase involved in cell wall biosynthesis